VRRSSFSPFRGVRAPTRPRRRASDQRSRRNPRVLGVRQRVPTVGNDPGRGEGLSLDEAADLKVKNEKAGEVLISAAAPPPLRS